MAAGRGDRARNSAADLPKQFLPLGGRAVVARSYDVLRAAGCDPIVVVVASDFFDAARAVLPPGALLAPGGATRAASVTCGLARVVAPRVVVHDAVRPFAHASLVRRVVEALEGADGAIAALPVDETLKRVDGRAIEETVARDRLWRAQTPQAFTTEVLREAHEAAAAAGFAPTDDAQALERIGRRVVVVPGERANLKLTFAEDFALAEALLRVEEHA